MTSYKNYFYNFQINASKNLEVITRKFNDIIDAVTEIYEVSKEDSVLEYESIETNGNSSESGKGDKDIMWDIGNKVNPRSVRGISLGNRNKHGKVY